ncbi:MAG: hypothetical protein HOI55_09200 [Candidatus Marinimicrobia bacterium]|jgi:hypothetical protein|nr:hypothetical protein [Candidatus Neomarinimicrobiota bacterium]
MLNKKAYSKDIIIKSLDIDNEEIKSLLEKEDIKTYTYTYEKFIDHFEELRKKDKEEWLVIGSSIVYSWMPTILNIAGRDPKADKNLQKIKEDAIESLNNISKNLDGESLEKDLKKLKLFINNSVVGMSKFLHFSFPDHYPIWDSRVESVLYETATGKTTKSNYHRLKIIDKYMEYRTSCLELIKDEENGLIKKFDKYEELKGLRDLRKIEFLLFLKGGKK